MYKVVNATIEEIVSKNLNYDDALRLMHDLNTTPNNKLIARNWYKDIERGLYQDKSGKQYYGKYVIKPT